MIRKLLRHDLKRLLDAAALFFVGLISPLAMSAAEAPTNAGTAAARRPNVLFIAIDDLNDWIGPLDGHPQVITPNLDRLAKRGVTFTRAYCQAPICNPSRASLLTGLRPSSTGIYYLAPLIRRCESTQRAVTIPQHFARSGYHSWGVGKIFHAQNKQEFQEFGGRLGGAGPRPKKPLTAGFTHPLWDWGVFPERDDQMPDFKVAAWAVRKLKQKHDKPFFLACGFSRPHVPLYAPQKWFDLYPLKDVQLPAYLKTDLDDVPQYGQDLTWSAVAPRHKWFVEHHEWKHAVQSYLACISFVDAQVGKLLDALDASDAAGNTVIILWSDHGFHLGTKHRWGKRSMWDESARVVLMASGPGLSRGTKCGRTVGLIDIYPTLIELCGLDPVTGLEGHSLVPLLKKPDSSWSRPALTTFGRYNHSVRTERWRYIVYADGSEELYDHQNDSHEFKNLAGKILKLKIGRAHV